ncbi:MAG: outer membrane lipoprotein carrier protein LolA, partial [Proteobacteria bacterium]|nr:outer membrane lipoprotein carrier protein LolA [Pseudomonadota bacterium]
MKPFLTQPSLGARTLLLSLSALIFLLLHQPLFAGLNVIESPEDIARRLQQNYDQIKSLSFHFTQSTEGELSGRPQQGSGTAWFVKEKKSKGFSGTVGKMRWDYTSPDKQILVSDGVDFSMYFAKLEQMIISPAESMQTDITYAFFTGAGNLLRSAAELPFSALGEVKAETLDLIIV